MQKRTPFSSYQWLVLLTLMLASFMGRLDGTIVNLALPKIISDFGITVSQASWINTAYIIANAIFVPIFGKLGDLIGRKPLYLFGIIGFTVTSALAGLSFDLNSLVILRILQAITVSIDYPLALSIIAFAFRDKAQKSQAMGLWSAIFAAAIVFGPLLGGPLIDLFSWRSVFYINIPIGIIATIMSIKYIQEPVKEKKGIHNFDIFGSLLLGLFLGVIVLVLDQGQVWGWTSVKSLASYAISIISLILFIEVERKQKEPIVDLKFFKIPAFVSSLIVSFISFMGLVGGIFLIPLFVETFLGYSVTKTGYVFIPMAFCIFVAAQTGARLTLRFQPKYVIAGGMFIAALGMFLFTGIDVKWGFWDVALRLCFVAFGIGLGLAPLTNAAISTIPPHEVGIASSLLALVRNISGAFGTAIFATILSNSITSNVLVLQNHSVINTLTSANSTTFLALISLKANILAYATVFKISLFIMLAGGITAIFVNRGKQKVKNEDIQMEI